MAKSLRGGDVKHVKHITLFWTYKGKALGLREGPQTTKKHGSSQVVFNIPQFPGPKVPKLENIEHAMGQILGAGDILNMLSFSGLTSPIATSRA